MGARGVDAPRRATEDAGTMSPLDTLADAVGPRNLLRDASDIAPYAVDWRGTWRGQPQAVLRPGTTTEVAEVVKRCGALGLCIVPAGGRTGLCGGAGGPRDRA